MQLALELDGTKLDGRSIRVKRSVKREKQKNKTDSKGTGARAHRGPMKGSRKGPIKGQGREIGGSRGGFKSQKKSFGIQQRSTISSSSFKGETVDPSKKTKKKGLKKKLRPSKTVHI